MIVHSVQVCYFYYIMPTQESDIMYIYEDFTERFKISPE